MFYSMIQPVYMFTCKIRADNFTPAQFQLSNAFDNLLLKFSVPMTKCQMQFHNQHHGHIHINYLITIITVNPRFINC